jgi:pimeloyl-ACP methyl ester carboxylesterase
MRLLAALATLALLIAPAALRAEPIPASVVADPPQDKAHPAAMVAFALPTHGMNINAMLYTAAGAGPHPTVLFLHGLPGNEQNLDLAQAMRREGWNVLTMHYRGAWGSPGSFTFAHCLEDAAAALAWLRTPENDGRFNIDPSKIVVIGHSLGGLAAGYVAAHDDGLLGVVLISPARIGGGFSGQSRAAITDAMENNIHYTAGMRTLGDVRAETLADEIIAKDSTWDLRKFRRALARAPLLIVTADDGSIKAFDDQIVAAVAAEASSKLKTIHLATDHVYSDQRIALEAAVIRWLENLPGAPAGL